MSIDITLAQRVERPLDEVAAFAMDPANDTRWIDGVTASEVEGGGPVTVGSRVRRRLHVPRHDFTMVAEVTAFAPPRLLELRALDELAEMRFRYEFSALDEAATLATLSVEGGTARGITGYVIRRALEKGVAGSLRRLAEVLGGSAPSR